ncbi:MAG: hypothetical protein LBR52_01850, partial [Prevotellaceae bacterium]|nr:hypothetical protein [Prevotellaceae bacterium]
MKKHFYISLILGLLFCVKGFAQKDLVISGGNSVSSYICNNAQVAVWGNNSSGRLGLSANAIPLNAPIYNTPQLIDQSAFDGGQISQVNSGSGGHFVALACNSGDVWAWGENSGQQVGPSSLGTVVTKPTRVCASPSIEAKYRDASGYLTNATVVYAGNSSSFAILDNGRLVAWGTNTNQAPLSDDTQHLQNGGQLGSGNTTTDSPCAVYVVTPSGPLENVVQIFAGDASTYALTANGTVYSWGSGNNGRLGRNALGTDNSSTDQGVYNFNDGYARPVLFAAGEPLTGMVAIACADAYAMALDASGHIWTWGNPWQGLGTLVDFGFQIAKPSRVLAGNTTGASNDGEFLLAKSIGGGQFFGLAVTVDGKPVIWGGGGCSEGGGGNSITGHTNRGLADYIRFGPAAANVHNDVVLINRGDFWGYYGRADGTMWAFGCGANGVLGIGSVANQGVAVRMDTYLPSGCGMRDFDPNVDISPKSLNICKSNFTSSGGIIVESGFSLSGPKTANYSIEWSYKAPGAAAFTKIKSKNTDLPGICPTGTQIVAADLSLTKAETLARGEGTYKVRVEYIGCNGGCEEIDPVEEEMVIYFFPQQFEAPDDLTFCGDSAEVHVNPKSPFTAADIAKKVYEWYPSMTATKAQALGITTGTGTKKIEVKDGTPKGDSIVVYVEEIGGSAGMFMKRNNAACQTTQKENYLNPGAINNQSWTGFTVTETVTITELKFLLTAWLYSPGSFTATVRFDIHRGSTVPVGGALGSLTAIHTTTATSEAAGLSVVTATGEVTLAPGNYVIGPANYNNGGVGGNGAKLFSTSCALSAGGNDDVSGSIIKHTGVGEGTNATPSPAARTMAFDIKFHTAQQFCDRIPVVIAPCPCDKPKKEEMRVPSPQMMCKDESITLESEKNVKPEESSSRFVFSWYEGTDTLAADRIAGPTATPAGVGGKLDLPLSWVAADTTIYTLKVNNTTQESCFDTIQVTVISLPVPELSSELTIDAVCSQDSTVAYTATSKTVGTTFSWRRAAVTGISNPTGSRTNGTISEKLINTTSGAITVTYEFTLKANGCENTQNVTVVVNPKPTVTEPDDQSLCAGNNTDEVKFTGTPATGVTYHWTNDKSGTTGIGLSDKGTGDIASFTAKNTGTTQVIANLTVTPVSTEGCTGIAKAFTITVEPEPVIKLESASTDAEVCQEEAITSIEYSYSGGATGADVTWNPSLPDGITVDKSVTGKITIKGTPTKDVVGGAYTYTITSTGQHASCAAADTTGKIQVNEIPDKLVGSQLTIDLLRGSLPEPESMDGRIEGSPSTNTILWYATAS